MPSIRARLAKYYISWLYGATHSQSPEERLAAVLDKERVADQDTPDALPTSITGDTNYEVTEERYDQLEGGQKWIVHHVRRKFEQVEREGRGQVIVYWHGGAFVNKVCLSLYVGCEASTLMSR